MKDRKHMLKVRATGRYRRKDKSYPEQIAFALLLTIVLIITGYELKLLYSEILIKKLLSEDINYEDFRELRLGDHTLTKVKAQAKDLIKQYPDLQRMPYTDEAGYLTFQMMASSYDLSEDRLMEEGIFHRGIIRLAECQPYQELYEYYKAILHDLVYFPVPDISDQSADVTYEDSWYYPRTYGGDRKHEGTDLMASNNLRGYFPVISITDGTVEKMGWLEKGGYRIGVRSESGGYFYYAHLYSYAPNLKEGDRLIAGQLLGFMGDSGYGEEGTIGMFDVHLHLGIYVDTDDGEMSVNPYRVLKYLEKNRTVYTSN